MTPRAEQIGPGPTPEVSVIIPAHDEEGVLPRLLRRLDDPALETIVVCNGCTDRTAEVAREASPRATVLETEVPSKVGALRLGDAQASRFPRFYVDADIGIDVDDVLALAGRLESGGLLAVAPSVDFDVSGSSAVVRAYYRVLPLVPSVSTSIAGTGCIGLSVEGRSRFDDWPQVLADDYFLDQLFDGSQKERVAGVFSHVGAPLGVRDLVRRRQRVVWGNQQVDAATPYQARGGRLRELALVVRKHPGRLVDVAVYVGVGVWVRVLVRVAQLRGREIRWNRDQSREHGR